MATKKDQDAVNNCYQPRGRRNPVSFFVILFEKWYNHRIYLFENQIFNNHARGK